MISTNVIRLLGRVQIVSDNKTTDEFITAHCRNLLAYLALNADTDHPRERLIEVLWPGRLDGSTRNRLSVTLYHLRRTLARHDPELEDIISVSRHAIRIDSSKIHIDYHEFAETVDDARRASDPIIKREKYSKALSMYAAPLLVDVNAEWSAMRQFETAEAFHEAAIWIANDADSAGDKDRAMLVLRDALRAEPNSERSTELLTRWYIQHGEPELASACARRFRRAMASQSRPLSNGMLNLVNELNVILVDRTRAVVFADEMMLSVLSLSGKTADGTNAIIEQLGGRKSVNESCWLFNNPVQALEAGKEIMVKTPSVAALIHTTIMSEQDEPPSISTSAHRNIKEGELLGTDASMHLLKSRGLEPIAVVERSIRLYKYG